MTSRRRSFANMLLVGFVLGGFAACQRAPSPPKAPAVPFNSVDITGAEYARHLSLTDADGKPRTLADFKGKVTVIFFGYTHCPDVCPTTMAELAEVKRSLGADGARIQGVFVTVDPERDSAEVLKTYVAALDPSFVALRGTPAEIKEASKEFKVFYAKAAGRTPDTYSVDHTAGSYVFDSAGRIRLFTRYGMAPTELASDLKQLLADG